jgi:hypothetical protein
MKRILCIIVVTALASPQGFAAPPVPEKKAPAKKLTVTLDDSLGWDKLSKEDQAKITAALSTSFKQDVELKSDHGKLKTNALAGGCVDGCNAGQAAAIAACQVLLPPGNAICTAAAIIAGEVCRHNCH